MAWCTLFLLAALVAASSAQNVLVVVDSCGGCGVATVNDIQAAFPSASYTVQTEVTCTLAFESTSVPTTFDALIYSQFGNLVSCPGGAAQAFANTGRFVLVTGFDNLLSDPLQVQLVGGIGSASDFPTPQATFNSGPTCDLLLNGSGGDIRGGATFLSEDFDSFTVSSAVSCLDATNGQSMWAVRPMANGGAIAYITTDAFSDEYTTIPAYLTALTNFMAAASSVTGGGGDPHLFGMAIHHRFDPVSWLNAVRTTEFTASDLVLVETESATITAKIEQVVADRSYITALEVATTEGAMVISVDEAGLTFTDSLAQATHCTTEPGIFGASLSPRVSVRGECTGAGSIAASNRLMQKNFASHITRAESHVTIEMDNVHVEVFSVRKGTMFLDFSIAHDVGTTFGGLLTNEHRNSARASSQLSTRLLERYAILN